jgi:hypothetical protein
MRKITFIGLMVLLTCAGRPGPKDVVFEFIDAVKTSDSLRVVQLLDLDAYVKNLMPVMSPEDSAKALTQYGDRTIQSLLGDGDTRRRWMRMLIVVNKETISNHSAEVEVSFIDQQAGHQLYTLMQLRRQPDGTWKVTYFR